VEELRQEQREEMTHASYVHTPGQVHGALIGGLVGALIGLVIGLSIGLLAFDAGSAARFVVPAVVTVFAAWAGVVYWGGREPEVERETTTIYGEPQDGSSDRPPEESAPAG
jgi:hypothetical protein